VHISYQKYGYYIGYEDYVLISWFSELIKSVLPSVSEGEINIMSSVALTDFKNWVKYKRLILGEKGADEKVDALISWLIDNQPNELKKIMREWLESWLLKWRQRVKIIFDENEDTKQAKKIFAKTNNVWRKIPYKDELKEIIIGSLISVGEICFTEVISESILRGELNKYMNYVKDEDKLLEILSKNSILILKDAMRNVKRITRIKGPLIVVRVDTSVLKTEEDESRGQNKGSRWRWNISF